MTLWSKFSDQNGIKIEITRIYLEKVEVSRN